jgi:hypothetical protein
MGLMGLTVNIRWHKEHDESWKDCPDCRRDVSMVYAFVRAARAAKEED